MALALDLTVEVELVRVLALHFTAELELVVHSGLVDIKCSIVTHPK